MTPRWGCDDFALALEAIAHTGTTALEGIAVSVACCNAVASGDLARIDRLSSKANLGLSVSADLE